HGRPRRQGLVRRGHRRLPRRLRAARRDPDHRDGHRHRLRHLGRARRGPHRARLPRPLPGGADADDARGDRPDDHLRTRDRARGGTLMTAMAPAPQRTGSVWTRPGMPLLLTATFLGFAGFAVLMPVAPLWAVRGGAGEGGAGLVNGALLLFT